MNPKRRKPELGDLQGKDRLRVAARLYYQTSEKCKAKHKVAAGKRWARIRLTPKDQRITAAQWRGIVRHFSSCCAYCEKRCAELKLTIDHMTPICRGGLHTWQNVVPACWGCNSRKHKLPLDAALDLLGTDRERFWGKLRGLEERLSAA